MLQPVLRTPRLLLAPLSGRHLELEVALDADADVTRYLFAKPLTRDEVIPYFTRRLALAGRGLGYWMAFTDRATGACPDREENADFVGLLMLPPANGPDQPDDPAVAELGYRLHPRFWRRGLASESSRELLRHAFETVGQERVIAQTMTVNKGSRGVMEAVGMRYVRTFVEHFDDPLPGIEHGEVEYEITRAEWAALRPAST